MNVSYADRRRLFGRFKIILLVLAGMIVLMPRVDAWPFSAGAGKTRPPAQQAILADTTAKQSTAARS